MKATAIAPANIAFIKYWGKRDEELRIPLNTSVSMNLSGAYTTTTVEFSPDLVKDSVHMVSGELTEKEQKRVVTQLERIRHRSGNKEYARVLTQNSFPKGTGAASSASGFAALTVAALKALSFTLSEKDVTILARIGSGSACRSIPDGFVEWKSGETSDDSYAYSLASESHWDLRDILVIVSKEGKKIATTEGMERIKTSPFWKERILGIPHKIHAIHEGIKRKDLQMLGIVAEEDTVNMHAVMMTQNPPLFYWSDITMRIIHWVQSLREDGLPVYFTIDAGPNVHILCEGKNEKRVVQLVGSIPGIQDVLINKVAGGAHTTNDHLF